MSASNYPRCITKVLKSEGGYVDHKNDPGGATNYGITIGTLSRALGRPATKREVRDISLTLVHRIYREDYWDAVKGDELYDGFDLVVFDAGVNSGPSRGIKWFQKGLGVKADGVIGQKTLAAAMDHKDGVGVIKRACKARMSFLRGLRHWKSFGTGWSRRVAGVEVEGVSMYARSVDVLIAEKDVAKQTKKVQNSGSATTVASGATASFADIPDFALYGIGVLGAVVLISLILKSRRNGFRIEAYEKKIEELQNE